MISDNNQTSHTNFAVNDESSKLSDQPFVLQDTIAQIKDVYSELRTCLLMQSENHAPNQRVLELESQVLVTIFSSSFWKFNSIINIC